MFTSDTLIISLIGALIIVGALVTFAAFVHLIAYWSTPTMKRITATTIMTIYYVVSFFFCWPMYLADHVFGEFSDRNDKQDNAAVIIQILWWLGLGFTTIAIIFGGPR